MSSSMIAECRKKLDDAEQQVQAAKRRVLALQSELKELQEPSNMTDQEATTILTDFFKRAKAVNDPFISDSSIPTKYYQLYIRDLPVSLRDDPSWSYRFYSTSPFYAEKIRPDDQVKRALNHFKIGWSLTEETSHHYM